MSGIRRVFVSETSEDMKDERKVVQRVLSHLNVPCVAMDFFGARTIPPLEACLSELRGCDLLLLFVGHRYGAACDDDGTSYTEKEYREAVAQGMDVRAYIRREDVPVLPAWVEDDKDKWQRLKKFKAELAVHTVRYYRDSLDLAIQLAVDLSRDLQRHAACQGRHGVERDNESSPASVGGGTPAVIFTVYGDAWPGLGQTLAEAGYQFVYLDAPEEFADRLGSDGLLIIPGSGSRRDRLMSKTEVETIRRFVAGGGALLCAGQAWSWAYSTYGNKPVEEFPLNRLGDTLGFRVTEKNVGDADMNSLHQSLEDQVKEIQRHEWAASEIQGTSTAAEPLVRDIRGRAMSWMLRYEKGRVIVVGHESMLEQNPPFFRACLDLLRGKTA